VMTVLYTGGAGLGGVPGALPAGRE